MAILLNAALYQAGWLACVLGAAHGMPWIGLAAAVAVVGWHLAGARNARREAGLLAIAALVGIVFETLLVQLGWVRYPADYAPPGMAPLWMVALWTLFATTLNVSLRWLRPHPLLAALLGAAAPAAYYAGARLGALELASAGAALTAIALGWVVATPALLGVARRLDGYARP